MIDGLGNFYSSLSGLAKPDVKYYDSYAYSASGYKDHARGKIGDATKETLKTFGSTTDGWNGDYAYLPNSTSSWFIRGGAYNDSTYAGIFNFRPNTGLANASYSFRSVITAQ